MNGKPWLWLTLIVEITFPSANSFKPVNFSSWDVVSSQRVI